MNWQVSYGGSGSDNSIAIIEGVNSSYLCANQSDSFDFDVDENFGETDIWMLELCESFLTRDVVNLCKGDSILWEGSYYKESGLYEEIFKSKCDLDSIKHLILDVRTKPVLGQIVGPDLVTEFSNTSYGVEEGQEWDYYWTVENGQFKDSVFDSFVTINWLIPGPGMITAHIIENDLCSSDTSFLEVYVSGVGVEEEVNNDFSIYPNPSNNGCFKITANDISNLKLYNLSFEQIDIQSDKSQNTHTIDISNYPKGIYFLLIESGKENYFKKIIYN